MKNYYSIMMEGLTYDVIENAVITHLSKSKKYEAALQIVKHELDSKNRIEEFSESVEGWDSICFIMFKFPLLEKPLTMESIIYRELTDTHYWSNEFHDTVNKIVVAGNWKKR